MENNKSNNKYDVKQILLNEQLTKLAHEAQDAVSTINYAFTNAFSLGQTEIPCFGLHWRGYGAFFPEFKISIEGNLIYRNEVKIPITEQGIFDILVAAFEARQKQQLETEISATDRDNIDLAVQVREFVQACNHKMAENNNLAFTDDNARTKTVVVE